MTRSEKTRREKDRRLAGVLLHQHGETYAVGRASAQREHHLERAMVEARNGNYIAAGDHRRTAARLERVIELLVQWRASDAQEAERMGAPSG